MFTKHLTIALSLSLTVCSWAHGQPASPDTRIDSLVRMLGSASYVQRERARLELEGLTPNQTESLKENPHLQAAHEGERIDTFAKESIANDDTLRHLNITPRYRFGPDVFDLRNKLWYDFTTPGQWDDHDQKYTLQFGQGTPLYYGPRAKK